jgi:hypothetical protein
MKGRGYICPDGKHCFIITKRTRDAVVALCAECDEGFDNDDPVFSLRWKVATHERRTGHKRFVYYSLEVLA